MPEPDNAGLDLTQGRWEPYVVVCHTYSRFATWCRDNGTIAQDNRFVPITDPLTGAQQLRGMRQFSIDDLVVLSTPVPYSLRDLLWSRIEKEDNLYIRSLFDALMANGSNIPSPEVLESIQNSFGEPLVPSEWAMEQMRHYALMEKNEIRKALRFWDG